MKIDYRSICDSRITPEGFIKNEIFKANNFPYPIERTASGTLYARMPNGELRRIKDKKENKHAS